MDWLPPTQALRAFEAAARHLSYSRAAEELSLTHGAVSHHIARLERDLGGVKLFVREGQRMVPTDAAQALVLDVRRVLSTLSDAFERARIQRPRDRRTLSVSVLPSFAARWLIPRLPAFQSLAPTIDIALRVTAHLATLDRRDGIDVAIRYGLGRWPGLRSSRLLSETLFPVCSPAFQDEHQLHTPGDLKRVALLCSPRQRWSGWFEAAGVALPEPKRGASYDDAGLLLQAAADGQGVALARAALASGDLATGRLVRLFDIAITDQYAWYLVWREPLLCDPDAHVRFRAWLISEARASDGGGEA